MLNYQIYSAAVTYRDANNDERKKNVSFVFLVCIDVYAIENAWLLAHVTFAQRRSATTTEKIFFSMSLLESFQFFIRSLEIRIIPFADIKVPTSTPKVIFRGSIRSQRCLYEYAVLIRYTCIRFFARQNQCRRRMLRGFGGKFRIRHVISQRYSF